MIEKGRHDSLQIRRCHRYRRHVTRRSSNTRIRVFVEQVAKDRRVHVRVQENVASSDDAEYLEKRFFDVKY